MARVSLKRSIIRFIDGFSATAAINDSPSNGDTLVTVDTVVGGPIPESAYFTVVGSDVRHYITDVSGNDWTFTPAFTTATGVPVNDAAITVGGRTLEIKVGDGNLTYEETREFDYVLDRGSLDDVQEGDEQPIQVNLDMVWEALRALTDQTPTPEEVLKNTGEASDWESSDSDTCKPYAINIEVETRKAGCPEGFVERITLPNYRWESLPHDLSEATVVTSGRCNVTQATVVREV